MRLGGEARERKRLHPGGGQRAVDEADVLEAQELAGRLAAERPGPDRLRRRPEAEAQDHVRRLGRDRGVDVGRDRRGGVLRDVGNPARILRRGVLLLARDGERVVGRDQPQHIPAGEHAELDLVGGDPEPVGDAHRKRGRDPGADLDRLRRERDAAGRIDLDQAKAGSEPLPNTVLTQARPTP